MPDFSSESNMQADRFSSRYLTDHLDGFSFRPLQPSSVPDPCSSLSGQFDLLSRRRIRQFIRLPPAPASSVFFFSHLCKQQQSFFMHIPEFNLKLKIKTLWTLGQLDQVGMFRILTLILCHGHGHSDRIRSTPYVLSDCPTVRLG